MRQPTEENFMQTLQADYFATYRNLKLSRDAKVCSLPSSTATAASSS